jgi:hypothetical protein
MFKRFKSNFLSPKTFYAVIGLHLIGVLVALVGSSASGDLWWAIAAILNLIGVGFSYALATWLERKNDH